MYFLKTWPLSFNMKFSKSVVTVWIEGICQWNEVHLPLILLLQICELSAPCA